MSEQNKYIRSITEIMPDEFPTLTPLPEGSISTSSSASSSISSISSSSFVDFFSNITWQTWIIIVLVLALIGINVFVYLAKGTQTTATIFQEIFGPLLKLFGYSTLETTKQTVQTSATGTKAGVDIVAGATTGAINTVQQTAQGYPTATSGTSTGVSTSNSNVQGQQVQGQQASSSLPVQERIQQAGGNIDQWQEDSLEKALSSASQSVNQVNPDDSRSSMQTTGKAGWCFIGEDQGIRTCAEIGVNDGCMSGDVFPSQAVCMNPKLRA
jgi:hypothetical protein